MITDYEITVKGTTFPARLTMGAMLDFKRCVGKEMSGISMDNIEELMRFMWCCIRSASRADGKSFEMSFEDFCDCITPLDIQAFNAQFAAANENGAKKK